MPRPNQDREKTSLWVKRSALAEVDEAAVVEGVARSEMLRRLLGLGLATWQAQRPRQDATR